MSKVVFSGLQTQRKEKESHHLSSMMCCNVTSAESGCLSGCGVRYYSKSTIFQAISHRSPRATPVHLEGRASCDKRKCASGKAEKQPDINYLIGLQAVHVESTSHMPASWDCGDLTEAASLHKSQRRHCNECNSQKQSRVICNRSTPAKSQPEPPPNLLRFSVEIAAAITVVRIKSMAIHIARWVGFEIASDVCKSLA